MRSRLSLHWQQSSMLGTDCTLSPQPVPPAPPSPNAPYPLSLGLWSIVLWSIQCLLKLCKYSPESTMHSCVTVSPPCSRKRPSLNCPPNQMHPQMLRSELRLPRVDSASRSGRPAKPSRFLLQELSVHSRRLTWHHIKLLPR